MVPLLEIDGVSLSQSLAMMEYLDETHPTPALLPKDVVRRAQVRALAQSIACEIHPLNNLRVLKYLTHELKVDESGKNEWYRHWVRLGLESFERQLEKLPRSASLERAFCYGDTPTLADCCLVPQIFNGQRFDVNFDKLPRTMAAFETCMKLDAFVWPSPINVPTLKPEFLPVDWPAPDGVRAVFSTRVGGVSHAPWDGFNLGDHVGDAVDAVSHNRRALREHMQATPVFMQQVHGTWVHTLQMMPSHRLEGDASITATTNVASTVLVADCLPVLFCSESGALVGSAHAGWRGLAAGVLQSTVAALRAQCGDDPLMAWLGPCIGAQTFEVGREVREAFLIDTDQHSDCFSPSSPNEQKIAQEKWLCDLVAIAKNILQAQGVASVHGNDGGQAWCTYSNPQKFFSHRRSSQGLVKHSVDAVATSPVLTQTGRMAACVWKTKN